MSAAAREVGIVMGLEAGAIVRWETSDEVDGGAREGLE